MSQLIVTLNTACVCEGNCDDHLTSLPTLRQDTVMDQSSKQIIVLFRNQKYKFVGMKPAAKLDSACTGVLSVYHGSCEILTESHVSLARCKTCNKHRRSLSAISSRKTKDNQTNPTTYSCLTPEEKDQRLHHLQCENKIVKLQVSRLDK